MWSRLIDSVAPAATSLRNRLTLQIFLVTLLAISALYLYVAPDLGTQLVNSRIAHLEHAARRDSGPLVRKVDGHRVQATIDELLANASFESGASVTLLQPSKAAEPSGLELIQLAGYGNISVSGLLTYPPARTAVKTGRLESGTETTNAGESVAEASLPVIRGGQVTRVIVYFEPITDVRQTVVFMRHQILVAGLIALLLTLAGGYLTARWLSLRVKRLERGADRVASGEFGHPLMVDSRDELGQLARAFNDMQYQLARLDSARKQFIATASHELRTPVFSLGGFVELLEDEDLDDETRRRFLGHVAEQVARLRKLSVDLLDLSRLESGALELRPELVDLSELARSVTDEFELALVENHAKLEVRVQTGAEAHCDPVRLAQIVRILIDNALRHAGHGITVVVKATRTGGRVRLSVSDDGKIGIDPAAMAHVFEPFFTEDESHGSGLGLAIASELAGRMSGRLFVSSVPGRTTFELDIPE